RDERDSASGWGNTGTNHSVFNASRWTLRTIESSPALSPRRPRNPADVTGLQQRVGYDRDVGAISPIGRPPEIFGMQRAGPVRSMAELHHECGIAAVYHLPTPEDSRLCPRQGRGQVSRLLPRLLLDIQNR